MNKQSDVIASLDDLDNLDLDLDTDNLNTITDTESIDDESQNNAEELEIDLGLDGTTTTTTQDTKEPSLDDLNLDGETDNGDLSSTLDDLNLDDDTEGVEITGKMLGIKMVIPLGLEHEPDLSFDVNKTKDKDKDAGTKDKKETKTNSGATKETLKNNSDKKETKAKTTRKSKTSTNLKPTVTYIHECEIEKIKTDRFDFLAQNFDNDKDYDKHIKKAIEKFSYDNQCYMIMDCHMVDGEMQLFNAFNIFEMITKLGITHVSIRLFENHTDYDIIKFAKLSQTN